MSSFVFAAKASEDLRAIVEYVSDGSGPDRAERLVRTLFDGLERIARMPGIGHRRKDLTEEDLRFWSVFDYLIVYRPGSTPLEIVRVLHGRRDVSEEL